MKDDTFLFISQPGLCIFLQTQGTILQFFQTQSGLSVLQEAEKPRQPDIILGFSSN